MSVLLLTEEDVRGVLSMGMALEAVEAGLRCLALDEAMNVPRARTLTDHCAQHVMSASAKLLGVMGYKAYATSRKGANFHVGLFDGKSGQLVALIQADYLGQVRTGAASGIATRLMARPDSAEVGIIGTGKQARTQVQAICEVCKIRRIQAYSPNEERRTRFAKEMSEICRVDVEPVPRPEDAVRQKDIVVTATTSREPVLYGDWLAEGTHINAIGSNYLGKAELDSVTLRRCKRIVVDSKDQARAEAGDFTQALDEGTLRWAEIHELGQVLVGRYPAREHPQDITLFKSLGIALEDIAVAARVLEQARKQGLGRSIDW